MDFTQKTYKTLIESLISKNYQFLTVEEYFSTSQDLSVSSSLSHSTFHGVEKRSPIIIMRHDVDRKPLNSLRMAKLEHELGIKATYYFRTISKTLKPEIIKQIAELGHEIGYHYENLCDAEILMKNEKSRINNVEEYQARLYEIALEDFDKNLTKLRSICPITNIAMHGRPNSKLDSRDLWKQYNYKDYGITSEPYFDIDFDKVLYITDAGRSWDNASINKRDKVSSKYNFHFEHTNDIIKAFQDNKLPDQIMINIHPEHWADSTLEWLWIWSVRKVKNAVKRVILSRKTNSTQKTQIDADYRG